MSPKFPLEIQLDPSKFPLTILPKDLWKIPDFKHLSESTIYRRYGLIRDAMGKKHPQRVTVKELGEYYGIPIEDLYKFLKFP